MRHLRSPGFSNKSVRAAGVIGLAAMVGIFTFCARSAAQQARGESVPVDGAKRAAIVDSVTAALTKGYVFPDVAEEMEKHVRAKLKRGDYDEIESTEEFAGALTRDLREISRDRHLAVQYVDPETMAQMTQQVEPVVNREREFERLAKQNFMFKKAEILAGNVGYLRLDGFANASYSGPTAVAALNFLAHCDAIIIDLRQNGGGWPSLIQLITSYFFEEPTHLNSFYTPRTDSLEQFWTHAYVPGPRMIDVDLYVLTSSRTFSGAEEFTYNLKSLKRATIIGETTGGGAHPVDYRLFPTLNITLNLPFARAINPVTGTNWEGTGVTPHIEVPQEMALANAHLAALRKLRDRAQEEEEIAGLEWAITGLDAQMNEPDVDLDALASYAGTYGARKLTFKDGALYYQRDEGPLRRAIPMSNTLFRFEDIDFFRLEVVTDNSGKPAKLVGHYSNGFRDETPRTDGK